MLATAHPCNVKEIKVFAGTTEDYMSEVLHAGLKNDTTPETYNIQYVNSAGVCIPTQFVKIMPLLSVLIFSTVISLLNCLFFSQFQGPRTKFSYFNLAYRTDWNRRFQLCRRGSYEI